MTRWLGYGLWGTIDTEHPTDAPHVTVDNASITVTASSPVPVGIDQTGDNNDVDVISSVLPTNAAQETGGILAEIATDTDKLDINLSTVDTDIKSSQPRKLQDGLGNALTSQANSGQRALDVGIDVAGVQVDPRAVRALTSSDVVTVVQSSASSLKVDLSGTGANATALKVDGSGATQPISGTVTENVPSYTRSDTYTTTGNGITVVTTVSPPKAYAIVVKGTGGVASVWDVRLEGSLDNVNFTQMLQHTNTTGDGVVLFSGGSFFPALYIRSRCAGLTLALATNIVVTILGV